MFITLREQPAGAGVGCSVSFVRCSPPFVQSTRRTGVGSSVTFILRSTDIHAIKAYVY